MKSFCLRMLDTLICLGLGALALLGLAAVTIAIAAGVFAAAAIIVAASFGFSSLVVTAASLVGIFVVVDGWPKATAAKTSK